MNTHQVEIVQASWRKVLAYKECNPIEYFYTTLFEVGGEDVKSLFKSSDLKVQGKRLLDMLTMAVFMLNDLTNLKPKLEDLAVRHINYGVKSEHYDKVAQALIATLALTLGDEWKNDKELQETWLAVWGFINTSMQAAAYTK